MWGFSSFCPKKNPPWLPPSPPREGWLGGEAHEMAVRLGRGDERKTFGRLETP